jgi:hypothetical protein
MEIKITNKMRFIDIDSTYRNRSDDALPASFTVLLEGGGSTLEGTHAHDPISDQCVLFPPQNPIGSSQLQWEPLAFYTDTDGVITERNYLPYVFSLPNTDTLLRLDALPIASTDDTTTVITPTTDLPELYIPLGRASNFYVGNYIENVNSGEQRKIIGFTYDTTPTDLQVGRIISYTVESGNVYITLDPLPNNGPSPSNVDRFYQGKYITFDDGTSKQIINYFINNLDNRIIQIATELSVIPAMGSEITISTLENWIVKIESAFSDTIPSYPAYQNPLPEQLPNHTKIQITNDDKVLSINSVRHSDDTIGVAYQTYRTLKYLRSNDATGFSWNTPITVADLLTNPLTAYSYVPALKHSLDLKLIDSNPTIVYTEGYTNNNVLQYIRSTSTTGSTWTTPTQVIPLGPGISTFTRTVLDTDFGIVRLQPRPVIDGADAGYPEIFFTGITTPYATYATDRPNVFYGSTDYDSPTWISDTTLASFNVRGRSVDMNFMVNCDVADFNADTGDLDRTSLYYLDRTTSRFTSRTRDIFNTSWDTPIPMGTATTQNWYGEMVQVPTIVPSGFGTRSVNLPTFLWQESGTNGIYSLSTGYSNDGAIVSGNVSGSPATLLISDATTPDITLGTFNGDSLEWATGTNTVSAVYVSGDAINVIDEEINTLGVSIPATLDRAFQINQFSVLESIDKLSPMVFYQEYGKAINVIIPSTNTSLLGVQYRIRETPILIRGYDGTASAIVSGTTDTIQLPSTASHTTDAYVGDFIWIYNQDVTTVPSPFLMFNDYRQIIAYDGTTQIATIANSFSGDIDTYAITGGNKINWEILRFSRDNWTPLVYSGSIVSQQEMNCWEVTLVSLVLPNILLSVGNGNRIAFYPYVYCRFTNITAQNRLILYSNNPNAVTMQFKVPLTNIVSPEIASFVALGDSSCTQTMRFKPNDNFRFEVILPNGEIFQTLETDTLPPFPPNPNIQVSALFGIVEVNETRRN